MRASRWVMAALFMASAVLVVEAQQPRQGLGRGGFDISALVLTNTALQEELKVTDDQKAKFKPAAAKQEKLRESFGGGGKGKKGAGGGEALKEFQAAQEEGKKVVEETLTAEQKKRLKQIDLQRNGVTSFTTDEAAAELKLTDAQKSKVKSISDDFVKDRREVFGGGGKGGGGKRDPEKQAENQKKIDKLSKAALSDVDAVLTDDQKKKWLELVGAPFDVSKLRPAPARKQD